MKVSNKNPKSALALYVKLYCKKKTATKSKKNNVLMEATKSWVTLSKRDKQYFFDLFQEYQMKLNKKFASNLQSAQPYMKRKHENSVRPYSKGNKEIDLDETLYIKDQAIVDQNFHSSSTRNNETTEIQNQYEQSENCNTIDSVQSMHEPRSPRLISEPTPPIRTSLELFEIIKNKSEDSMQNVTWTDLSNTQKRKYRRALTIIKSDYIIQYATYLEQLTPKQLFYHYKSKF